MTKTPPNGTTWTSSSASDDDEKLDRLAHYSDPRATEQAVKALDAGSIGCWHWDIANGVVTGDPMVSRLFNIDYHAQPWSEDVMYASIHPEDLPKVQAKVETAFATSGFFEAEFRDRVIDPVTGKEGVRWLGGRASVTKRDKDGNPTEMIGVNWDATENKVHEQRLALLAREMDHRVKNAFAVIRALVTIGVRMPGSKESFAETLANQVQAMADVHAISAEMARKAEAPAKVPMEDILAVALEPWLDGGALLDNKNVVTLDMSCKVEFDSDEASAFAMLIYELTTNATKFGALGQAGGQLSITVTSNEQKRATMNWVETVTKASGRSSDQSDDGDTESAGFGSTLITHCVTRLRADLSREMTPTGLHLSLELKT